MWQEPRCFPELEECREYSKSLGAKVGTVTLRAPIPKKRAETMKEVLMQTIFVEVDEGSKS